MRGRGRCEADARRGEARGERERERERERRGRGRGERSLRIARAGYPFIAVAAIVAAVALVVAAARPGTVAWSVPIGIALLVVTGYFAFFFRDPERAVPEGDR